MVRRPSRRKKPVLCVIPYGTAYRWRLGAKPRLRNNHVHAERTLFQAGNSCPPQHGRQRITAHNTAIPAQWVLACPKSHKDKHSILPVLDRNVTARSTPFNRGFSSAPAPTTVHQNAVYVSPVDHGTLTTLGHIGSAKGWRTRGSTRCT